MRELGRRWFLGAPRFILIVVMNELRREYEQARGHLEALQESLDNLHGLGMGPEWGTSLCRLLRELTDQLELAVDQIDATDPQRFVTRPPRLR